jgi:hypothetical protein
MTKAAAYRKRGLRLQKSERKIQEAVDGVKTGRFKNCNDVALKLGLKWLIIWRHVNGKTSSRTNGHLSQQLLSVAQEKVLKNWIKWLGYTGLPISKQTVQPKVEALCGWKPSWHWIYRFLQRNPDCMLGRSAGLDPKRCRERFYSRRNTL